MPRFMSSPSLIVDGHPYEAQLISLDVTSFNKLRQNLLLLSWAMGDEASQLWRVTGPAAGRREPLWS